VNKAHVGTVSFHRGLLCLQQSRESTSPLALTSECQRHLLRFLRHHGRDPRLDLPDLVIHWGRPAALLTRLLGASAVTFGRRVWISPRLVEPSAEGAVISGALLAHEATHTLQYAAAGFLPFLLAYLRAYGRGLRREGAWSARGRTAAYHAIPAEQEAEAAEQAYREWRPDQD
jgi:hypothetical protein